MKIHRGALVVILASSSFVFAQRPGQEGRTPPTFPENRQNNPANPDAMPPDHPVPPNPTSQNPGDAQGEQNDPSTQPETMSSLTTRIQQAIASDSMLQISDVRVKVKGGEIELTGTVATQQAKDRAEQIAAPYATRNNLKLVNHISVQS